MPMCLHSRFLQYAVTAVGILAATASAQDQKAVLQKHLASIRESLAKNQQALRQYKWTETTEFSLKGEQKTRSQKDCHYGPDGQVVKTPIGAPPPSGGKRRGLKGKIVEKKTEELKEYMERAGSLIHHYVPPDADRMKAAADSGKAAVSRNAADGSATIEFKDYYKAGDLLSLTFSQGQVKSIAVKSYLDSAADAVTLDATFQRLADGTNYLADSVLNAAAKQIRIHVNNFGHTKTAGQ